MFLNLQVKEGGGTSGRCRFLERLHYGKFERLNLNTFTIAPHEIIGQ